jgi:ribonuclease BN (tRNA processing enzyme)
MTLALTVLGSAGMFATAERASSGYLLEIDGRRLWLDAGAGTWQALLRHVHYRELSGVMLTHRHPDHTSDLFMALHAREFGEDGPQASMPLWAPQETLDALCSFYPDLGGVELRPIAGGESIKIGDATLSFVAMAHPAETVGVRIEHGESVLAYSADTGPGADFDSLAEGADLFLCEATMVGDKEWEGHLNAAQAVAVAARVGVRRLVLTHLPPERDPKATLAEIHLAEGGPVVELAEEGRRFEV